MTMPNGSDAVVDSLFSYQQYNRIKNHWYGATAPSDPQPGMIWVDSDDGKSYVYYGSAWVEFSLDGHTHSAADHGGLTGLGDDDHSQYHNNTRGDARYPRLTLVGGTDITSGLTNDDTWNNYDATAVTSASATWIILFVHLAATAAGNNADFALARYGLETWEAFFAVHGALEQNGGSPSPASDFDSGQVWLKLDSSQRFNYCGRIQSNTSVTVKVIGYVE